LLSEEKVIMANVAETSAIIAVEEPVEINTIFTYSKPEKV